MEINQATSSSGFIFDSSIFTNNFASGGGGAVANLNTIVRFTENYFAGNYAMYFGGALFTCKRAGFQAYGCTFEDNRAGGIGGAIFTSGDGENVMKKTQMNKQRVKLECCC